MREAVRRYDPAELDREMLISLFDHFAEGPVRERLSRLDEGLGLLSEPMVEGASIDDFAESLIRSPEDIREVFSRQYFFGCEADDPMAAVAFDERLNPLGARIPALFASDIGHWDVPDFRRGARGGVGTWSSTASSTPRVFATSPSPIRCDSGRGQTRDSSRGRASRRRSRRNSPDSESPCAKPVAQRRSLASQLRLAAGTFGTIPREAPLLRDLMIEIGDFGHGADQPIILDFQNDPNAPKFAGFPFGSRNLNRAYSRVHRSAPGSDL